MIFYISSFYKRFCNRNNGVSSKPVKIFNHTVDTLEVSIVDPNNQLVTPPEGQYYLVGSFVKRGADTPVFLCTDFSINDKVLSFNYSTYTYEFLNLIRGENVQIALEIGYKDSEGEHVILQDTAFASQRYYVEGMPDPARLSEYYTKTQTDAVISSKIEEAVSGLASQEYVDEQLETKQDLITEDSRLDYALISGTPSIPTKTSDLENDSDFVTSAYVQSEVSGKQNVIDNDNKLAYSLLSGTPSIPTKTSDLENDTGFITSSALEDYATETFVTTAISGKADKSEFADYQKKITPSAKLDYGLLSSTPSIPTKTSDLQNDSGFITDSVLQGYATETFVTTAISGKADKSELSSYQEKITPSAKLDYGLLSSTPSIPTKTSDLQNDSDFATSAYVQGETSGKLDNPSGGTTGQVLTKTSGGVEWADSQGGSGNPVNVPLEIKTLGNASAYLVDFTGKAIQKYDYSSAASGTIAIDFANLSQIPSGVVPTLELQIPITGNVSTITLPSAVQIVEMPNSLEATSGKITYHDIVCRAEKDSNGTNVIYVNYAYKFDEDEYVPPVGPVIPTNGLVFYASFDNSYNDSINNLTPTVDGQQYISLTTEDGIPCYKNICTTRSTAYLTYTDSAQYLTDFTNWTVSFWMKPVGSYSNYPIVGILNTQSSDTSTGLTIGTRGNGSDNIMFARIGAENFFDSSIPLYQDTYWDHWLITKNGDNILFFMNGQLDTTNSGATGLVFTAASNLMIGQTNNWPSFTSSNYALAGLRIYNRALDSTEIAALASEFTPINQ